LFLFFAEAAATRVNRGQGHNRLTVTASDPFRETNPNIQLGADTVAKVENQSAPKISRKLIFGRLCCCVAFQRH
jgi:hypothetical protein